MLATKSSTGAFCFFAMLVIFFAILVLFAMLVMQRTNEVVTDCLIGFVLERLVRNKRVLVGHP